MHRCSEEASGQKAVACDLRETSRMMLEVGRPPAVVEKEFVQLILGTSEGALVRADSVPPSDALVKW